MQILDDHPSGPKGKLCGGHPQHEWLSFCTDVLITVMYNEPGVSGGLSELHRKDDPS